MQKQSAGVLLYRENAGSLEVLLVHPGGPFWARKDDGAWSVPKGEFTDEEDPLEAAKREFEEETGFRVQGDVVPLSPIKQPSGKVVHVWAVQGDLDAKAIKSNMFSMEWPRNSGVIREFPEIDRADWYRLSKAKRKLLPGQVGFLDQLVDKLGRESWAEELRSSNTSSENNPVQGSLF
jgi:predicted NUDIX family NTP pyrophosphohydrolase